MNTAVTIEHLDLTRESKEFIAEIVSKIDSKYPTATDAHLFLKSEGSGYRATLRAQYGNCHVVYEATGHDHLALVRHVTSHVLKQLATERKAQLKRKLRSRRRAAWAMVSASGDE